MCSSKISSKIAKYVLTYFGARYWYLIYTNDKVVIFNRVYMYIGLRLCCVIQDKINEGRWLNLAGKQGIRCKRWSKKPEGAGRSGLKPLDREYANTIKNQHTLTSTQRRMWTFQLVEIFSAPNILLF